MPSTLGNADVDVERMPRVFSGHDLIVMATVAVCEVQSLTRRVELELPRLRIIKGGHV